MDGSSMVVDAMGGGAARRLAVSVLPVGSAVVSLIVIVAAERRLGPPTNCRALVVAAPLAVAVTATPMLFLPVQPASPQRRFCSPYRQPSRCAGRPTDVGDVGPAVRTLAARRR